MVAFTDIKLVAEEGVKSLKPSMKLKHGSTRGHMAEFILGASATAKLIAGSQDITPNDTKTIMRKGATNLELSIFKTDVAKDSVEFINIIKNQANKDDATDVENLIDQMNSEIEGSTSWANQDQGMKKLSKYFETNEKPDKLRVKSAGEEGQKDSKVDVDVIYIKPDGSERVVRPISLKAGSNLIGQASPRTFETFAAFVKDLGVELAPVPDYQENVEKHIISILQQISADFNKDLAGDDLAAKQRAVQDVYKFLDKHAGLNDKKLLIVQIEGPNFSAKKITKIRESLKTVDLDASFKKTGRPAVLIHEAGDQKSLLFQIRYTFSAAKVRDNGTKRAERHRMVVETGSLFEKLATVATSKQPEKSADSTQPTEPAQPETPVANDPNATVKENMMQPTQEFGPNYNIVDDLHVYMRNNDDVYRRQYFPMLCAMQEQLAKGKKISAKEVMMPVIKTCMASYNKKYNLANESTDIITDEDIKTLVKKIYTEEIPLIKKGVYK